MADLNEHGYETSGRIKCVEFSEACQDVCSVMLDGWLVGL